MCRSQVAETKAFLATDGTTCRSGDEILKLRYGCHRPVAASGSMDTTTYSPAALASSIPLWRLVMKAERSQPTDLRRAISRVQTIRNWGTVAAEFQPEWQGAEDAHTAREAKKVWKGACRAKSDQSGMGENKRHVFSRPTLSYSLPLWDQRVCLPT